jgi:hypothetical protein
MHANRIHQRTVVVLSTTTVVVALLGVTSAAAASSGATWQGRVVIHCDGHARFGPPGPVHGQCTITGALTDRGSFTDDAVPCANPHVSHRQREERHDPDRGLPQARQLDAPRRNEGVPRPSCRGWESSNIPCNGPGPRFAPITMVGTVSQ